MLSKQQTAFHLKHDPVRLERVSIPVPKPAAGEVLIKVAAVGACHSDLHILHETITTTGGLEDYVMGHEVCGYIVAHGAGVDAKKYPIGHLVALHGPNGCGNCSECRSGHDNCCLTKNGYFGLGAHGGYQQYVAAACRSAVLVPKNIKPEIAAATTDAVLTPYHAIKRAGINAMSRVLVIGVGGLGLNAVQICKAMGAKVYAQDLRQSSLENAKKFGADEIMTELPKEKLFVDYVLDMVGVKETFRGAQFQCKPRGSIVLVGMGEVMLDFVNPLIAVKELQVEGTFWGTSSELSECLDLVSRGLVSPQVETQPLDSVKEGLAQLERGEIQSRLVFIPGLSNNKL